ncbi:MAG: hypothetical protein NT052_00190 [Candidatus Shapirobacteria bacterium]|nr:hypothetical protein [Candidatus Shapirobacteria bacterium]
MVEFQEKILKTLAYADVFAYPLTLEEIHKFLISDTGNVRRETQNEIRKQLNEDSYLVLHITYHDGFYCFKNRQKIIQQRLQRFKWSQEKTKIAQEVANWLRLIPFIKMVSVTGNLAMKNADENDDIDLLIITGQKRLWLTRLLTIFLIELVSKRRRPGDKKVKDKICLNMFLDEKHLAFPKSEQNLFTAHEICQLKILWQREKVYQKFSKENQWYKKFLPNWKS